MTSQPADERDAVPAVSLLITQLGVGGRVALIAEMTKQQSACFLLSGERQKAVPWIRDVRIVQRAARTRGR